VIVCKFGNLREDEQDQGIEDTEPRSLASVIVAVSKCGRQKASGAVV